MGACLATGNRFITVFFLNISSRRFFRFNSISNFPPNLNLFFPSDPLEGDANLFQKFCLYLTDINKKDGLAKWDVQGGVEHFPKKMCIDSYTLFLYFFFQDKAAKVDNKKPLDLRLDTRRHSGTCWSIQATAPIIASFETVGEKENLGSVSRVSFSEKINPAKRVSQNSRGQLWRCREKRKKKCGQL